MSQWGVQLVIGRLITDAEFRRHFEERGTECLARLRDQGIDLNDVEVAALAESGSSLWRSFARRIDRRLRSTWSDTPSAAQRIRRPLTARERRVLRGVFEGLGNKQIAGQLGVSESAIKATLQHLFRKARVRTRTQLVRVAIGLAREDLESSTTDGGRS
jgi:DNA-binding NarL/FixJ family response regulator